MESVDPPAAGGAGVYGQVARAQTARLREGADREVDLDLREVDPNFRDQG